MGRPRRCNASLEELMALRERGYNNAVIGQMFGVSDRTISMMLNPESYERQRAYQAKVRAQKPKREPKIQTGRGPLEVYSNRPIEEYMLPRQRVKVEGRMPPADTRSLTGKLLGDPVYERSALAKIRGDA
jgi:hypothetical protein